LLTSLNPAMASLMSKFCKKSKAANHNAESAKSASTKQPSKQLVVEKKEDDTYTNGQVVDAEYTKQMGQRKGARIPKWMRKRAKIPDHVQHLKCEQLVFPKFYYRDTRWAVLIRNVLTKQECRDLIAFSEHQGYEEALVNIGYGQQQKMPEFRNCKRMIIDNWNMVNCLWTRCSRFIPQYFKNRKKVSFNERLRFLRYHKGEFFAPHYDGVYQRPNGERSCITFLLYLNDEFEGGNTKYLKPFDENRFIAPSISPGMVVMFQHDIYHEGQPLLNGTKYIVRTDVMFTQKTYSAKQQGMDPKNKEIEYELLQCPEQRIGWDVVETGNTSVNDKEEAEVVDESEDVDKLEQLTNKDNCKQM